MQFGLENVGKNVIIVSALCGGEFSGADYLQHVRSTMEEMGVSSCKADSDVRVRPDLNVNGVKYHQHVLLCTDGVLAIVEEPERFIREEIGKRFTLKEKSIGSPEQCLG